MFKYFETTLIKIRTIDTFQDVFELKNWFSTDALASLRFRFDIKRYLIGRQFKRLGSMVDVVIDSLFELLRWMKIVNKVYNIIRRFPTNSAQIQRLELSFTMHHGQWCSISSIVHIGVSPIGQFWRITMGSQLSYNRQVRKVEMLR